MPAAPALTAVRSPRRCVRSARRCVISPVGTSSLTSPKALAPDSFVRVLTAIEARSSSTGAPLIDVVVVGRLGARGEEGGR